MESERRSILLVDDSRADLEVTSETLRDAGYEVVCAENIPDANRAVVASLVRNQPFNLAMLDLNIGLESGGEFGRRLIDVVGVTNVAIVTGYPDAAKELSYQPDSIIIKSINLGTLLETAEKLMRPVRKNEDSTSIRLVRWRSTGSLKGFDSIKPFSSKMGDQAEVEKITGLTMLDSEFVNCVIYDQADQADNAFNVAVSSLIGCPAGCRFCLNWRIRKDRNGMPIRFKRPLSAGEIAGQIYLAMNRPRAKAAFAAERKLVVNFSCEGDGLVYNLGNCCQVIEQLSGIENIEVSCILTSIGSELSLREYILRHINLPVRHYWSVNSLVPERRAWLMPGTAGQSLQVMRDYYQLIAERTGRDVTVSWIVIRGVTDRAEDAAMIETFFAGRPFRVKLMGLVKGSLSEVGDTSEEDVEKFRQMLEERRIPVRVRRILGSDIYSGCGNTVPEWLVR